jgi:sugar transferase (PEP-CTERM/EpsH1 system associated)
MKVMNDIKEGENMQPIIGDKNEQKVAKPKLLILTSRFPYPLEKGDKLRIFHQMKALSKDFEIILCSITDAPIFIHDYLVVKVYCSRIYTYHRSNIRIVKNLVRAFLNGLPLQIGYFFDKSIQEEIHAVVKKEKPDHIFCQLIRTAEYVRDLDVPKTLDYMDTFSIGAKRWAKHAKAILQPILRREANKLAAYENAVFNDFDFHTIISAQDRDFLQTPDNKRIKVVPNGVDTSFFKPMPEIEKIHDIAFIGNMGYVPNVEGARYLVQELLPKLIKKYPNIKILIAGARPTALVQSFSSKNVTVTGWVEDIRIAYASANIFVAPLFLGSGQQNKILEAMSMEVPCITTNLVNNAIGAKDDSAIILADDANAFVKKIESLLDNPTEIQRIGIAGKEFVKDNYSWEHYVKPLEECFGFVSGD